MTIYMFIGGLVMLAVGGIVLLVVGRRHHKIAALHADNDDAADVTETVRDEGIIITRSVDGAPQDESSGVANGGFGDVTDDAMIDSLRAEMHDNARKELERVIGENVNFIKEDVRRNTSELNGYMQQEVSRVINQELVQYKTSAQQVSQATLDSISKAQSEVAQQYHSFTSQLNDQLATERQRLAERVYENITDIVEHYIVAAVGNQLNVDQQLSYIVAELEANKAAIVEDIRRGA